MKLFFTTLLFIFAALRPQLQAQQCAPAHHVNPPFLVVPDTVRKRGAGSLGVWASGVAGRTGMAGPGTGAAVDCADGGSGEPGRPASGGEASATVLSVAEASVDTVCGGAVSCGAVHPAISSAIVTAAAASRAARSCADVRGP